MKKRRFAAALFALALLLLPLSACGGADAAPRAIDLTASVTAQETGAVEPTAEQFAAIMEFGLSLLREGFSGGNSLISPVSLLLALGMTDAFSANDADFSGISRADDLFISRVLHKAYIAVNEKGTRAGAATAVDMGTTGTMIPEEHKTVILDRPFVYLILDTKYTTPVFLGVLMDPGE